MIWLNLEDRESEEVKTLEICLSELTDASGVINAKVTDEEEVRRLNHSYAGKDESTDVLSFSYLEDQEPGIQQTDTELGDIVISNQHVASQARQAGTDENTEFILLLLHGALHILGYDHVEAEDRRHMEQLQSDIMARLGLVYRDFKWADV